MKFIKTILILVSTLISLAVTPAFAGGTNTNVVATSVSPYRASEFSLAAFGGYQVTGTRSGDSLWSAGIEADFFFTKNIGVALATSKDRVEGGGFFQNLTLGPVVRFPIKQSGFAPYVTGGIGFDFDRGNDRYYYAGGGLEYRFTKNVGLFSDISYVFQEDVRTIEDGKTLVRSGLRWAF